MVCVWLARCRDGNPVIHESSVVTFLPCLITFWGFYPCDTFFDDFSVQFFALVFPHCAIPICFLLFKVILVIKLANDILATTTYEWLKLESDWSLEIPKQKSCM